MSCEMAGFIFTVGSWCIVAGTIALAATILYIACYEFGIGGLIAIIMLFGLLTLWLWAFEVHKDCIKPQGEVARAAHQQNRGMI